MFFVLNGIGNIPTAFPTKLTAVKNGFERNLFPDCVKLKKVKTRNNPNFIVIFIF